MTKWQRDFLLRTALNEHYIGDIEPIFAWVRQQVKCTKQPFCLGINGAQGSGKSTLSAYLKYALQYDGFSVAVVSLDDFYLSNAKRKQLAAHSHWQLKTRGVPGTHDIERAIEAVASFKSGRPFVLPRFDKSSDNPLPRSHWENVKEPADVLIFEGWCVGLDAEPIGRLNDPVNQFEQLNDQKGTYRQYVNECLSGRYQSLFSLFDKLLYLNVGSFERVFQWRLQQEVQLKKRTGKGMSKAAIHEFIQYFERLTLWGMASLPVKCDYEIWVDENHRFLVDLKP